MRTRRWEHSRLFGRSATVPEGLAAFLAAWASSCRDRPGTGRRLRRAPHTR